MRYLAIQWDADHRVPLSMGEARDVGRYPQRFEEAENRAWDTRPPGPVAVGLMVTYAMEQIAPGLSFSLVWKPLEVRYPHEAFDELLAEMERRMRDERPESLGPDFGWAQMHEFRPNGRGGCQRCSYPYSHSIHAR